VKFIPNFAVAVVIDPHTMEASGIAQCAKVLFADDDDGGDVTMEVEWNNDAFATPPRSESNGATTPISAPSPTRTPKRDSSHFFGEGSPCISRQAESFLCLLGAPKSPRALLKRAKGKPGPRTAGTPQAPPSVRAPNVNPFTPEAMNTSPTKR
jgi:hypothetical protein